MITHDEAVKCARIFGAATQTKDRRALDTSNALLNQYLKQPGNIGVDALLKIAVLAANTGKSAR